MGDFSREEMDISEYNLPHIKAISLVDKVRVVNALIGFSRIQPAMTSNDVGFVDVKEPDTRWYPAYEVRGEGISIKKISIAGLKPIRQSLREQLG